MSATAFEIAAHCGWLDDFHPEKRLLRGRAYAIAKLLLDLTLILVALPLLIAVFLLCALAIKVESPHGPVFFRQVRTGKGGRSFRMYKFRTMVPNAEQLRNDLTHLNEGVWPDFQIRNDPRRTRVGSFLRKTSLDELPQLINVVRGEMSLVGPRPNSWGPETYQLWQTERLEVEPGITGLAQLVGRKATDFHDRVRLDIAYIQRRSLWLDVQILLRTIPAVLQGSGAH